MQLIALMNRPRGLPEVLIASRALEIDLLKHPMHLWMVDCVLACAFLPAGVRLHDDSMRRRQGYNHQDDARLELQVSLLAIS
ncbi:MAG: hypothetical protein SGPRY_013991 [Prymnesium sp.]